MFRYTTTFLLIFLVLNHDFAAARRLEFDSSKSLGLQWRDVIERPTEAPGANQNYLESKETSSEATHSIEKRKLGALFRTGLRLGAGAGFTLSTGSSIYHAIQKCKDYRPRDCGSKKPTCRYMTCPNVCHGPETNRNYIERERNDIKTKLNKMDGIQRDAFNLATQAIEAGLNNQRILTEIDRINSEVTALIYSIAKLDIDFATKFRNRSVQLKGLLRNELLGLDDIVAAPEVDGIFDKWTWEGTGIFVISLALPLSLQLFSQFRKMLAINEIQRNLKSDFAARFQNQKTSGLNPNAKLGNKFAYVQGVSTKNIDSQLRKTAKAIYHSDQANKQVSKVEKFTQKYIGPAVNAIVIALSIYTTYSQINNCQLIANDVRDTAITMAEKADGIEKIKQEEVDPLLNNVTTQAWPRVRGMMTRQKTQDWLSGIRDLTLGAANVNYTTAATIKEFIDNINASSFQTFIKLQMKLYGALESVRYQYSCLRDKQHAVTTVITDCRSGRDTFPELYKYASEKHQLNNADCIAKTSMPYTTQSQFFKILSETATHQGWYSNCLLNSEDLLYRVCAEKTKGYTKPQDILKQVNKVGLTEDMVTNFLTRCPPPKITPASIKTTCSLYCLYQPVSTIAPAAVLLESQVIQVQKTCPICSVTTTVLKKICNMRYCLLKNATTIEKDVRKPLPTVNFIIANNCSGKCVVEDENLKKKICEDSKCKCLDVAKIAKKYSLPEQAVTDVIANCDAIVKKCVISPEDWNKVASIHCSFFRASAEMIYNAKLVDLCKKSIACIIDSITDCPAPTPSTSQRESCG